MVSLGGSAACSAEVMSFQVSALPWYSLRHKGPPGKPSVSVTRAKTVFAGAEAVLDEVLVAQTRSMMRPGVVT